MPEATGTMAPDVEQQLDTLQRAGLLRFITCGSVDDGKSTLIGRLLLDCQALFEDQLASLGDRAANGPDTGAANADLASLIDGLTAEQEQGITIDVAYRYFATEKRRFIIADTPGHEQYTRNMVTGASTGDLALLTVDARKGILTQSRRHAYIVSLLGIRDVILAVNKMDLVDWDQSVFETIADEFRTLAAEIGIDRVSCIPVSALYGDNVTRRSKRSPWFAGKPLLHELETAEAPLRRESADRPLRLPVQWVNRPHQDLRGYAGTIASGSVAVSDRIAIMPAGTSTTVSRIVTFDGDLDGAVAGQAVTVILSDEIDVSRGDILASTATPPAISDQFAAHVVWMQDDPLMPGRDYVLQLGTTRVGARATRLKHKVNVNTLEQVAASHLDFNEIGYCNIGLDRRIPIDPYRESRETGGFILIDRITNMTAGCGMIDFPLRRASNIRWQAYKVDKPTRSSLKDQKPCVLWFTGLSGAGKSTIADLVEQKLLELGKHTIVLDGDNVRQGLNRDLGFTDEDRIENIRRVAEVSKLMLDAGLIVLTSFISPFRGERTLARRTVEADEFIEIFVDAPLGVCEERDPKGLYRKARAGELPNFTGISSPYEPPLSPEIVLESAKKSPQALAEKVISYLAENRLI